MSSSSFSGPWANSGDTARCFPRALHSSLPSLQHLHVVCVGVCILAHVCEFSHKDFVILCLHAQPLSRVLLFATPWIIAHQALPSMGFSRQEYRSGLSFTSPGNLPDPWIEPVSPMSHALAGEFFTTEPPASPYDSLKVKVAQSCPTFATPWTIQSMEFSRPEYWSG